MTFTITLHWWLVLPLTVTLVVLCGGLWTDRVWEELESTIIAAILCLVGWLAILYGRYEPFLVLPLLLTITVIWQGWREKWKREARRDMACVYIVAWAFVLYGRLTA